MIALQMPFILTARDLADLMTPGDWLDAAEAGFRAGAEGRAVAPPPMHLPAEGGGFHAKGARIELGERSYAALKFNGNFPDNPERGLPTVQGALILSDAADGRLLAVMDSIELTLRRTAAASALAARLLARPDSATLTICGCGAQGRAHFTALAYMLPLKRCYLWDSDQAKAHALADELAGSVGTEVIVASELGEATRHSDVVATCTSARSPFLGSDDVRPGALVAAIGADNEDKSEIAPELMARAAIVTDSTVQCLHMGDLRHAVAAGAVSAEGVRAELGEVAAGLKPGRLSDDEILLFDSTGTALQDVAAAAMIYERACAERSGSRVRPGA